MSKSEDDLKALEQFVVDNDKLLELEARIGRFNIFDALRIVDQEIRHSNFLAWLLDPGESHGVGGLFLNAVLMDLLRKTPPGKNRLFSPIKLDGGELRGVEIRREWKNIDLLITCKDPSFVIAIENKVRSQEHSNQLSRYAKTIAEDAQFASIEHRQFVYLTREGDEPTEQEWTIYSYRDLYDVLTRIMQVNQMQMGEDVKAFIQHYHNILRSRLMDDDEIIELCKDIYRNHRQAIDLVVEHAVSGQSPAIASMRIAIEAEPEWEILKETGKEIIVVPTTWKQNLPNISAGRSPAWIYYSFNTWGSNQCGVNLCLVATDPPEFRENCFSTWMDTPNKFGMRNRKKKLSPDWNCLNRINIEKWSETSDPPTEKIVKKTAKLLSQIHDQAEEILSVIQNQK